MRKVMITSSVIAIAGLLMLYNNCGQPRLQKASTSYVDAKPDHFTLTSLDDGPVQKIHVTPGGIRVVGLPMVIGCTWDGLLDQGVESLVEAGGMQGLVIDIGKESCAIDLKSTEGEVKPVTADPTQMFGVTQRICYRLDAGTVECHPFVQQHLDQVQEDQQEGAELLQNSKGRSRLFDSQNG